MQIARRFAICLLAASLGMAASPAWADDDCDVPVERWQSREAVTQMARQKGWDLKRVKIDDGCYEVKGKDQDGRSFKAKLDPETLVIVKMKYRDHEERGSRRHRAGDRAGATPSGPGDMPRGRAE
ncbi:PepSY domain-containing protein [Achromobacter denitrificans]